MTLAKDESDDDEKLLGIAIIFLKVLVSCCSCSHV